MNIGTEQGFKIEQVVIQSDSGLLCAYPAPDNFKTYRPDRTSKLLKFSKEPYQVFRDLNNLVGELDDSKTFNTYVTPIGKNGRYDLGYLAI